MGDISPPFAIRTLYLVASPSLFITAGLAVQYLVLSGGYVVLPGCAAYLRASKGVSLL